MGKCSFLRQKKQVQINGEWVDTRSYRYLPYCDVIKQGITIKNGPPKGEVKIFFKDEKKYEMVFENGKSIYLDENGYGHIEIERNKLLDGIWMGDNLAYPSCEVEVKDCDVHYIRMTGMGKVNFSCSRLITDNQHHVGENLSVNEITFNSFDTSKATYMGMMFYAYPLIKSLDVSSFNTSNVTNMGGMFGGCSSLTSLDISSFDTSNVSGDTAMSSMFEGCSSLKSIDVSKFNTSKCRFIDEMFKNCSSLTSIDVSSFDTSHATHMDAMFEGCSSIKSIDISNFNIISAKHVNRMFKNCSSLTSITIDTSEFYTSNLYSFDEMFSGCSSLVSLDLSGLYISDSVHTGENLFSGCSSLEFLDLSRLYLGVHNYKNMFNGCSKLKTIRMVGCAESTVNKIKSELTYAGILNQVTIITE